MTEAVTNFFINEETRKIEILGVSRDITERKKAEKEIERKTLELYITNEDLQSKNEELTAIEEERRRTYEILAQKQQTLTEQEASLRNVQAIAHLGYWEWKLHDNKVHASDELCRMICADPSESLLQFGDICNYISPGYRELFTTKLTLLRENGSSFTEEFIIIRHDGTDLFVRCQGIAYSDESNSVRQIMLIFLDITQQKRMEKELTEASKEKEMLLKEIHHRVKNNMQVISSLLSMQSRSIQDVTMKGLFKEAQTRVRSLSLVHELLYKSESLNSIDYRRYIQNLTNFLLNSYGDSRSLVTCLIPPFEIQMTIEKAVPCSLIITELVTNSLKYAFTGDQKGEISIDLQYDPDNNQYILHYHDNGRGFPAGMDPQMISGFGTKLIQGLTRQLTGTITIADRTPGVHYTITFPSD